MRTMQSKAGKQALWQGMVGCGVFLHGSAQHRTAMHGSAVQGIPF